MVVYYYEANCQAEKKMVHYHQCQGHSEGLYDQKHDYFYYIFQTAGPFATKLGLIVQHYKP